MKTSPRNTAFSTVAFVLTFLLSWWVNFPAITSTSNVTVWGLLASVLFCVTWCAVALLQRKNKAVLWGSFLITLCSLLVFAINAVGLTSHLHLDGLSFGWAIVWTVPYLGFALLSEVGGTLVFGLQCLLFFIFLVYQSKKALIAPVLVVVLWIGITWCIPLDALAPPEHHLYEMTIIVDNINQPDLTQVDVTDDELVDEIYRTIQNTTVRYIAPSDKVLYGDDDCIITLTLAYSKFDLTDTGHIYLNGQKYRSTNGTALYDLLVETVNTD